jgi:hypothetical protein
MSNALIPPSRLVVHAFGGVRAAARALDCEASAISRWSKTGLVPASYQRKVLKTAWERGIDITAHDIVFGREVA